MITDPGIALCDDFLRITGLADAHALARWLTNFDEATYAWEQGKGSTRYAQSLLAEGGILLCYGRRNQDQLDAPQSDTRDSKDIMLEVPGRPSSPLLARLRESYFAPFLQVPRRDIQITFRAKDPEHVYRTFSDLVASHLRRPCHRIGPDGSPWPAVTLQTHEKQAGHPRFAILYDKHAQNPDEYPERGTLRIEFRFQPEKQAQKRALFERSHDDILNAWSLSRHVLEWLTLLPREKSFAWIEPAADAEFDAKTLALLHSYGPTISRGIAKYGRSWLERLALATLLQADPSSQEATPPPKHVSAGDFLPQSE